MMTECPSCSGSARETVETVDVPVTYRGVRFSVTARFPVGRCDHCGFEWTDHWRELATTIALLNARCPQCHADNQCETSCPTRYEDWRPILRRELRRLIREDL